MIQLLRYQFFLHVRLVSTYVMLAFVLVAFGLIAETPPDELRSVATTANASFIIVWVTLTFVMQLASIHHFFFRPEALQYRLARLRNRSMVISGSLIHVFVVSVFATIPFAVLYFGMLDDGRIAMLCWLNMVAFFVFLGMGATMLLQWLGSSTTTSILIFVLLFLVPMSLEGLKTIAPAFFQHPMGGALITLLQSHLDVSSNPDMLIFRGIQDTDALLRTLILTPILATITYVRFLRGDHH